MNVLAIDTAASFCAACIFDAAADQVLASISIDIGKGHVEELMPVVAAVLETAGCKYADLKKIAVSTGPGSFTGVRVGVAAARGFALALQIPAVGVSTLEAIAAEARRRRPNRPVLVGLDARREEIHLAVLDETGEYIVDPRIATLSRAVSIARETGAVLAGTAAPALSGAAASPFDIGPVSATAGIQTIARLGAFAEPRDLPKPMYLRPPDAKPQIGFAVERVKE